MYVADARDGEGVGLHGRRGGHGPGGESEVPELRIERGAIGVGDDEGAGAQLAAVEVEIFLGHLHLDVLVLEAEGHQVVVAGVLDHEEAAGAFDAAGRLGVGGEQGHGLFEDGLIGDLVELDVAHVLHGPAGVVVGARIGDGVVLHAEVHVDQRVIGLVAADDVIAGGDIDAADLEGGVGLVDFDALAAQFVDQVGGVGLAALRGGDHPGELGAVLALVDGALVFQPVVFEIELVVLRHLVHGDEQGRFLDVGVVARSPVDGGQRRIGAIPFAAGLRGGEGQVGIDVGAVALDFVEAAEGVVGDGDPEEVVGDPAIVEAVGEDAGNAALGHLHDFGLSEQPPFVDGDGVERGVVGAGAGGDVEVGLRLVQIVQDGGVPFEHALGEVLGDLQILAHAVAIVVVLHVLAPVHQRQALAGALVVVIGIDLAFAAVHFDHGGDEGDGVVADGLDERGLFHDQAVGELDQHFGSAGFGRVYAAVGPVERLADFDELAGLVVGDLARVAELGEDVLVLIEVLDGGLVGDGEDDLVAAFLGLADLPEFGARGGFGEGFVVAVDVLGVGQFAGLAGNAAEEFEGRGDGVGRGHVVHQFGGDARVLQILFDELGVLFVDLLGSWRGGRGFRFLGLAECGAGNKSAGEHGAAQCDAE